MSLLSFLLLSLGAVHASPLRRDTGKVNLAISTKINSAGVTSVVEMDRARILSLTKASHPVDATNNAVLYTVEVGVGTPPTYYTLMVDTGSSNTWVGARQSYVVTGSSVKTGNQACITNCGSGPPFGLGAFWLDTVTLTPELVINNQSIGVASWTMDFNGVDGIFGIGPVDETQPGAVSNTYEVITVTDNLHTQGKISQEVLGIFFSPVSKPDVNGELTFGGYDSSLTTSSVNYVPLTSPYPASAYWGINQSVSYGNTTILSSTAGGVDPGTTLIYLASDAFQQYQSLTGATMDPTIQLLTITSAQYSNLQTLSFNIGGTSYNLSPNGQIWPRSLNSAIGGSSSAIYLVVNDIDLPSGSGIDFINGYGFLQRFYSVFDTTNQRIGFAETMYTDSTTN